MLVESVSGRVRVQQVPFMYQRNTFIIPPKPTVFLVDFYCMPTGHLTVSTPRHFLNSVLMYFIFFLQGPKAKETNKEFVRGPLRRKGSAITISLILPLRNVHLHLCSSPSQVFPAPRVIQHNGQDHGFGIRLEYKSSHPNCWSLGKFIYLNLSTLI